MLVVAVAAGVGALISIHHDPGSTPAAARTTTTVRPTTTTSTTSTLPPDVAPLATGSLPGEGVWTPAGRRVGGTPALFTTTLRPPTGGPPVGVARIDTTRTDVVVFAGTSQPGGTWTAEGAVPAARQPSLVAAFNGGFQFGSSGGGFYADGRARPPLRDGAASLVVHRDGTAEVDQWGRDAMLTPDVAEVRQNLTLLVDQGVATPAAASWADWGATLGHVVSTWRSAVGSDARHDLYFVGGPSLSPKDLASVLVAVGATRAMELDINPQWVFCSVYFQGTAGTVGTKLLPSMNFSPTHVLVPSWRDFVAVFAKAAPGPW